MKSNPSSLTTIIFFVCLSLVGISLIPRLSVHLTNDRLPSSLKVSFSWPDASAKLVEQEITSKLEGLFGTIQGIKEISSTSGKGKGDINILFKNNVEIDAVRFEISNLIRQINPELPYEASYPQISASATSESKFPILSYSIKANESPYYIKKYTESRVLPKLALIQGVSRTEIYGAAPYEWTITYNADMLQQLDISVDEIRLAINSYLKKSELGVSEIVVNEQNPVKQIAIQLSYYSANVLDLNIIPIKKINNRIIHLEDIANVQFEEGPVKAYYRVNGLNTLNMAIYSEKGVNSIELAKRLRETINEAEKGLPEGYEVSLTQDATVFLVNELKKIQFRTFFSLLILVILSVVVYRNIKYLCVLFLGIAANLLVAVIFYYALDVRLQLYSFAGITISFGIIIDNSIVMMDHVRNKGDKKVFLAILASTFTTIGAVLMIFLLEENQRLNLWDFALVIIINIGVSLLISYFLIPALMHKLDVSAKTQKFSRVRKRRTVRFTKKYMMLMEVLVKPLPKWGLICFLFFVFGLPLSIVPKKMVGDGFWTVFYNNSFGDSHFSTEIRPTIEKIFGGTLRLFKENVFENSYYPEPQRTTIKIKGAMPEGCTIVQLNTAIEKMEQFIAAFDEVELFETRITSYQNSDINIYFERDYEYGSFPFMLKSLLESKAIKLGGVEWSISGIGRGFSNTYGNAYKNNRILLEGYDYDKLYSFAKILRSRLQSSSNERVKNMEINSSEWWNTALLEYSMKFHTEQTDLTGISIPELNYMLRSKLYYENLQPIVKDNDLQGVRLISNDYQKFSIWDLQHSPILIDNHLFKLNELAAITKKKTGNLITKMNQQYRLVVAYDFIGPEQLSQKFLNMHVKEMSELLPIGYRVFEEQYYKEWSKSDKEQYYILFIIVAIILFICSILLESLRQPLIIISLIPISFIGIFLTFYIFDLNFDQGGYASFVLLSGISVNSALFVINDYNNLRKKYHQRHSWNLYFKAFNSKIIPILLTVGSTIAGLVPFVWQGQNEVFWFAFAAGSIGGLFFSLLGIFLYLPLFVTKTIS